MITDPTGELRALALAMEKETHGLSKPFTSKLLDIANAVEVMDDNLIYVSSCMAATAEDLNDRKSTPSSQITRQHDLMEICARVLAGIPVMRHKTTRAVALARVERIRSGIANRMVKAKRP